MANLVGESNDPAVAAVSGTHTAAAGAVIGQSNDGRGVIGISVAGQGVWGVSDTSAGVYGESTGFNAVRGISHAAGHGSVVGINDNTGDQAGPGVYGESRAAGVLGKSTTWHGVYGETESTTGGQGVSGLGHTGVAGVGRTWVGVYGETNGAENGPAGVWGDGKEGGFGVKGHARAPGAAGVAGYQLANAGPGIFGAGAPAGLFHGDVEVTGDLRLSGADVAEEFEVTAHVEAGTVMVLDDHGAISPCRQAYDVRVAGIVSGAGDRKPALILDRQADAGMRGSVALVGKAWCLADATAQPIAVGSLLTTSATIGHAMAATDRDAAFGAVLGKALTPLNAGTGLVLVLCGLG